MAEQPTKVKRRRLKPAQTMRERAERTSVKDAKPSVIRRLRNTLATPFVPILNILRRIAKSRIWKPVTFCGRLIGRILFPRYLRNSWKELRMVTWPSGKQTRQLTGAVIAFSVIFGLFVAAFDYGLDRLFKHIILK